MSCDICGKASTEPLVPLLGIYQTDDIKQICHGCESVVNKQLRRIQSVVANIQQHLLRRFITERKAS